MIAALVAVFVFSGAAGLIYESLWSRYLGLFVGHSAYAQIIVLVIFLGGMSLGAHLIGRRSHRIRSPLIWYAVVEIVVGLLAIVFHDVFEATTAFSYDRIFPAIDGIMLISVKWTIASLLILPQSVLLGATFPLMSAGVIRLASDARPGRTLSLLYFANSLGAAAGVLVAGMYLIGEVGLPGTLLVAGFINVVAAAVVFLIARFEQRQREFGGRELEKRGLESRELVNRELVNRELELRSDDGPESTSEMRTVVAPEGGAPEGGAPEVGAPVVRAPEVRTSVIRAPAVLDSDSQVLLIVAFGTAAASFIYEVAWIRMLSLVLGSATRSFELMLSAFILGLALGALWIRNRADTLANPTRFLGYVQWVMGVLAVATLPLYIESFDWTSAMLGTVASNENGYKMFTAFRYLVALLIMLPATFCAGMTLPLITRILMLRGSGERAIGTVYAVNTLGSIIGVILAGLVLMPMLGLKRLLVFGALIDIALGVWLVVRARDRQLETTRPLRWGLAPDAFSTAMPVILTGALLVAMTMAAPFGIARLTSGVYRHGMVDNSPDSNFPFYKDGRTATVSIEKNSNGFVTIATNGKPDASMERAWIELEIAPDMALPLTRDVATQFLLPLITLAHNPGARQMAVIGQGSGMSSHMLLGSPYASQVVTIEIEPEMIEASRHFMPANRRVFQDTRSRFMIDDAKSYFASSGRKFDLILSEPSNPWVSGVSGLFTVEFYTRVKRQLADNGVFGQWLHLYELNDGLVHSVLSAIDTTFGDFEVFYTSNGDILVVAANQKLPDPDWRIIDYPDIKSDLARAVTFGPEWFEVLRLGGKVVLHPLLMAHGEPNSDFFPTLDLNAEKMRFMHLDAEGYSELTEGRFDMIAALSGRRLGFGVQSQSPTPEIARSKAYALSARIQALRHGVNARGVSDADARAALNRIDRIEQDARGGRPPRDWHTWMMEVVAADEALHSGTAGVVDTAFFRTIRSYATRAKAPPEVVSALNFLHGIGAWDWPEAARSAKSLFTYSDTATWIPNSLLRNGATTAFIMTKDTASAKDVLRRFARFYNEDRMRERILGSILISLDPKMRAQMGWK